MNHLPGLLKDLTYEDKNLKLKRDYKRQTSELFTLQYNIYLFRQEPGRKKILTYSSFFSSWWLSSEMHFKLNQGILKNA